MSSMPTMWRHCMEAFDVSCHSWFKHWLIKWNIQQRQQYQLHNVSRELPSSSDLEVSYWLSPRNGNPEVFANLQENVDLNVLDPFHSFVSNVPSIIIINVTSLEAFDATMLRPCSDYLELVWSGWIRPAIIYLYTFCFAINKPALRFIPRVK